MAKVSRAQEKRRIEAGAVLKIIELRREEVGDKFANLLTKTIKRVTRGTTPSISMMALDLMQSILKSAADTKKKKDLMEFLNKLLSWIFGYLDKFTKP